MITDTVIPLPRRADSARAARAMARDACVGHVTAVVLEDVALVVSELVTNAIMHGDGEIQLRLQVDSGSIVVGVQDTGANRPQVPADGAGNESGRGMTLVAAVAQDWGVRALGDGKEVWCVLGPDVPAGDRLSPPP